VNVEQMKLVLSEILLRTDLTPCVVGHRGVGKSAGILQVCREIEYRYVPLRLGQMEVGDLIGIPYRDGEIMRWSRPSWWPQADEAPTVVHCDELNRAQQEDTLQAIFQFVEPPLEGRCRALHTHPLDSRHKVVVSINPPDGSYQVATLDRALLDRMVLIDVGSDYACWARYAHGRQLDRGVQEFLSVHNHLLAAAGAPVDLLVEPTERAWEMVSTLRQHCRFPAELEMEVYAGLIGREAAVMFLQWTAQKQARPVMAQEILERWPEVAEKAEHQRHDLQGASLNDLVVTLEERDDLPMNEAENLVAYLAVLPRDLRFGLIKSLLRIPYMAAILSDDRFDTVVFDAIAEISREAS